MKVQGKKTIRKMIFILICLMKKYKIKSNMIKINYKIYILSNYLTFIGKN